MVPVVSMLVTKERLNKIVSHMPQVRREVTGHTNKRAAVAKAKLAAHRYQGHAKIESYVALVDGYIVLSDEAGYKAAAAIEYGRRGEVRSKPVFDDAGRIVGRRVVHIGPSRGVGALAAAAAGGRV